MWFRDSTRREAERLGISGYAKNLPSGDVEVLASGTDAALDAFALWLDDGPPLAKVAAVVERSGEQCAALSKIPAGFEVG